jgi:long-chain acyl-CoA synthetase
MLRRPALHYPEQPVHAFVERAADLYPEKVALVAGEDRLTYRQLDALSNAVARGLLARGLGTGHRVVLAGGVRPEWIIASLGVSKAGAAIVPVNPRWKQAEMARVLELTEPTAVLAEADALSALVGAGFAGEAISFDATDSATQSLMDVISGQSRQRVEVPYGDIACHEAVLPFSSGTTGLPKAVRRTHRDLVAAIIQWKAASGIDTDDRLQFFLPLFHIYGIKICGCTFAAGATMHLLPDYDLDIVLAHIEREQITIGFGATPIAMDMANHPDIERYDLSSLRYMLWSATPVIEQVAEQVTARTGLRWLAGYGLTEMSSLFCNPVERPELCRLDSPGVAVSDVEARIVDPETLLDLAPGEHGELLVRGPGMMAGYLPAEANEAAFVDGWLRTGDIGWLEPDGWLHLTDRRKELIRVSGFSVSPLEIEQVLLAHPAVTDCAVVGIPDDRSGEVPIAAVVPGPEPCEPEELLTHMARSLARYKLPRQVVFVVEIPRSPSGKTLRRLLAAEFAEAKT